MASDDEAILSQICDTESQPGQGTSKSFSAPGGSKVMFEGKEYDYVFDIDADNGLMLKLPYNLNDNPWQAAQDFIHKNELPPGYLDTIANFITKNLHQLNCTASSEGNADPFTGAGTYSSSSGVLSEQKCRGCSYNKSSLRGHLARTTKNCKSLYTEDDLIELERKAKSNKKEKIKQWKKDHSQKSKEKAESLISVLPAY